MRQLASIQLGVPADVIETWNLHAGAKPGPAPAHDMNIWLGAYQPRMLGLVGRVADGWIPSSPYLPPEQLATANRIIDAAAIDAGRSPDAVRRIYNIGGEFSRNGKGLLQGPPAVWVEQLTELTLVHGVSGYILCRVESGDIVGDSPTRWSRRYATRYAPSEDSKACPRTPIAGWIDCVRGNPPGIEVSDE